MSKSIERLTAMAQTEINPHNGRPWPLGPLEMVEHTADLRTLLAEAERGRAAYEFVKLVGRLDHTGDEGYLHPDEPDDALYAMDRLIAKARDIMAEPLRAILGEALSQASGEAA